MYERELAKKEKQIKSLKSLNGRLITENEKLKQDIKQLELKIDEVETFTNKELREEMIASIHEYKKLCETVSELKTKYEDNLKDIVLTMEALAFRQRFPYLSGFAMRCLAKEFNTDYGRIAQIESIQGFDFTFIEDGTKG